MNKVIVGIISRIQDNKKQFLLIASKKDFGKYTGYYYPPGGHIEDGEDKKEALKREIKEELGVEVVPIKEIAETMGDVDNQTTYWWLCDAVGELGIKIQTEEIDDVKWFSREEIAKSDKLWPATKRFFEEYILK